MKSFYTVKIEYASRGDYQAWGFRNRLPVREIKCSNRRAFEREIYAWMAQNPR